MRELGQSVKCSPCQQKDLSSIPGSYRKNAALGRHRQTDLWGSLARRVSLIGRPRSLRKTRWAWQDGLFDLWNLTGWKERTDFSKLCSDLHTHSLAYARVCVHA